MEKKKVTANKSFLRQKAEHELNDNQSLNDMSAEDLKYIIHELQVHKIELVMQNEQLEEARQASADALNKYSALFNLAPVAYLIINNNGLILEANNAAADLFETLKSKLIHKKLTEFLHPQHKDYFYIFFKKAKIANNRQVGELELLDAGNISFHAKLICIPDEAKTDAERNYKLAIIDITDQKHANDIMQSSLEDKERLDIILQTQEQERKRIAETLHNGVGQVLYAMKIKIDRMIKNSEDKTEVMELSAMLKEMIDDVKSISYELVPTILEDFGLEAVIHRLCKKFENADIKFTFNTYGYENRLDLNYEISIFRIVQELVNNIIKHARANYAGIFITITHDIAIRVEDNGIGMNKTKEKLGVAGMGLRNITNRVKLLNGTLELNSENRQGTLAMIRLPFPAK